MEINSSANVSLHTIQKNSMKLAELASQNIEESKVSSHYTVNISEINKDTHLKFLGT